MADFELKHEKHTHYMSAAATGITLTGPLGDGFVHMIFHRDGSKVVSETFDAEQVKVDGVESIQIKGARGPARAEFFREEVADILVPAERFAGFADAIAQMAATLIKGPGKKSPQAEG